MGDPLARPLVVLGGWRTPHWTCATLARRLAMQTDSGAGGALPVSFFTAHRIEDAAERAASAILERWPAPEGGRLEVDAVGISMGGIVGRLLAAMCAGAIRSPNGTAPPIRVVRLFTIGTPHRGARLARLIAPDPAARQMRAGSDFLRRLDEALPASGLEVIPYARLHDGMVGARNASPPGMDPLWRRGPRLLAHLTITRDEAFTRDIARRLKGEATTWETSGPAPHD